MSLFSKFWNLSRSALEKRFPTTRTADDVANQENRDPSVAGVNEIRISLTKLKFSNDSFRQYRDEIYRNMLYSELHFQPIISEPNRSCLRNRERTALIRWMIQVSLQHKVKQATLFNAIGLVDRYCFLVPIRNRNLMLLAATCLFTTSKYEQIQPLEVRDMCLESNGSISARDIYVMEMKLLNVLQFKLSISTVWEFREMYLHVMKADVVTKSLSSVS